MHKEIDDILDKNKLYLSKKTSMQLNKVV